MKKFWKVLGTGLAKASLYCLENPNDVIQVIQMVKVVKSEVKR